MSFGRCSLSLALLLSGCGPVFLAPGAADDPFTRARPWTGTVDAPADVAVRLPGGTLREVAAVGDVTGDGEPDWAVVGETSAGAALHLLAGPLTGELVLPDDALVTLAEPGTTTFTDAVIAAFDGGFAVGSPNDNFGGGRVFVFHAPVDATTTLADANLLNGVSGEEAGAALAVADLDGDGAEELLVGAPRHGWVHGWEDWDPGRVYAIPAPYVNGTLGTRATATWTGTTDPTFALFSTLGASIAVLDDGNGDGLPELAFGAPELHHDTGEGAIAIAWSPHPGVHPDDDLGRIGGGSPIAFGLGLSSLDADADGEVDLVAHGHWKRDGHVCFLRDWATATTDGDCSDSWYPSWGNFGSSWGWTSCRSVTSTATASWTRSPPSSPRPTGR